MLVNVIQIAVSKGEARIVRSGSGTFPRASQLTVLLAPGSVEPTSALPGCISQLFITVTRYMRKMTYMRKDLFRLIVSEVSVHGFLTLRQKQHGREKILTPWQQGSRENKTRSRERERV